MNAILEKLKLQSVVDFCRRWDIVELAVFGSVLRDDFSVQSDIDLLLTFAEGTQGTLYDYVLMKDEMEKFLGREVDLINRKALERSKNRLRREEIEQTAKIVFVEDVAAYA